MSHKAMNWAMEQEGLSHTAFRVLLRLADRHNPDYGCFPSQKRLAVDCCMSRSTVNLQLNWLEKAGLIRREQRRDEACRQDATRYFFPFEEGFETGPDADEPSPTVGHGSGETESEIGGEPSPKNGENRVRQSDTKQVREPVSKPVTLLDAQARLRDGEREAAAPGLEKGREGEATRPPMTVTQAEKDRRFWATFSQWPRFEVSSKRAMLTAWAGLADEQRDAITPERVKAYLDLSRAAGVNHPPAVAVVLGELDLLFSPAVEAALAALRDEPEDDRQPLLPYGKAWCVFRLWVMRCGKTLPFPETAMEPRRSHLRWPFLANLDSSVLQYAEGTRRVPQEDLDACCRVKVGSAEWAEWEAYHHRMDWLMVQPPADCEGEFWVWFPARVPQEWKHFEEVAGSAREERAGAGAPPPRSEGEDDSVSANNQEQVA